MRADLEALAAAAGTNLETYTLARVITSEAGGSSSTDLERVGVGWATWNRARIWARAGEFDAPITARVTFEVGQGVTWRYGKQSEGPRFVSTREAPTARDLLLASQILRGLLPDPTGGAQSFLEPTTQDRLIALGTAGYSSSASEVLAAWLRQGWKPVAVIGKTLFLRMGESPPPNFDVDPDPPRRSSKLVMALVTVGLAAGLTWLALKAS